MFLDCWKSPFDNLCEKKQIHQFVHNKRRCFVYFCGAQDIRNDVQYLIILNKINYV